MTDTAKIDAGARRPVPEGAGLSLLRRELEALASVMPGLMPILPTQELPTEAEVEAGFDNVPV